jgi:hypothetical protein
MERNMIEDASYNPNDSKPARKPYNRRKPEQASFYVSTFWTQRSAAHRVTEPLCRFCHRPGAAVDHINNDQSINNSYNLMTLCASCHGWKTSVFDSGKKPRDVPWRDCRGYKLLHFTHMQYMSQFETLRDMHIHFNDEQSFLDKYELPVYNEAVMPDDNLKLFKFIFKLALCTFLYIPSDPYKRLK